MRFGVVFILALILRVGICVGYDLAEQKPSGDASEYVTIAMQMTRGAGYTIFHPGFVVAPTARRSPLFPVFLAGCFALFGPGFLAPLLCLCVIGAATCPLLSALAHRLFDETTAWVVGLAAAVYPALWITSTVLMTETLFVFLLVAVVYCADRATNSGTRPRIAVPICTGVVAGLLALTRAEGIVIGALALGWMAIALPRAQRWRCVVVAGAAAVIISGPWVIRNYIVFGGLIPGSTVGGWVLAGANNPDIYYTKGRLGGWTAAFGSMPEYAACAAIPQTDEISYASCLTRTAIQYAIDHRDRWPALVMWRLRRTLDLWDPLIAAFLEKMEGRRPAFTMAAAWAFYPVLLLSVLGMLHFAPHFRRLWWLYAIPAFYLLQTAMTWGIQRLRTPMEPFLLLLACAFVVSVVGMWKRPAGRPAQQTAS